MDIFSINLDEGPVKNSNVVAFRYCYIYIYTYVFSPNANLELDLVAG